jgi:hypothetical protein
MALPHTVSFIADAGTKMPSLEDGHHHTALSFFDAKLVGRARVSAGGGMRVREEAQLDLLVQWMTKVCAARRSAARPARAAPPRVGAGGHARG